MLTEKALRIQKEVIAFFDSLESEYIKGISEDELMTFYLVLDKINDNIERIDTK